MAYQPCHSEGTHRNEDAIKQSIVNCCRRGTTDSEGRVIPPEKRGAGKGSHFIANQHIGLQTTPEECIARMRKSGILPKKERKSNARK